MSKFTAETYVMPFGKYKSMKINDIINIKTVDKNNEERQTGIIYLQWLCSDKCDWFRHKDIVNEVLSKSNNTTKEYTIKEKVKKTTSKKVVIAHEKELDFEE